MAIIHIHIIIHILLYITIIIQYNKITDKSRHDHIVSKQNILVNYNLNNLETCLPTIEINFL